MRVCVVLCSFLSSGACGASSIFSYSFSLHVPRAIVSHLAAIRAWSLIRYANEPKLWYFSFVHFHFLFIFISIFLPIFTIYIYIHSYIYRNLHIIDICKPLLAHINKYLYICWCRSSSSHNFFYSRRDNKFSFNISVVTIFRRCHRTQRGDGGGTYTIESCAARIFMVILDFQCRKISAWRTTWSLLISCEMEFTINHTYWLV